jgi:hypothetical protein
MVIIRNKPPDMSLDEYMGLLRINFRESFLDNKSKIELLKSYLLDARKEILLLQNKDDIEAVNKNNPKTIESLFNRQITRDQKQKLDQLNEKFQSNLQFLASVVKLKSLDKETVSKLDEINNDTIIECLRCLLNQIGQFVFSVKTNPDLNKTANNSSLKFNDSSSYFDSQFTSASYLNSKINLTKLKPPGVNSDSTIFFPIESILHSAQLFINVFEIEWFFYSRNALADQLGKLIEDLIVFILNFKHSENVI